ncbi:hypothetical protein [Sphingomonas koreensis]
MRIKYRHHRVLLQLRRRIDTTTRAELSGSRNALDTIRPNARIDLETAMSVDPKLIEEAAQGKPGNAIRAMKYEAGLRVDPPLRADTFVRRWQALDRQRRSLLRDHETWRAGKVSDTMIGMAKSLGQDRGRDASHLLRPNGQRVIEGAKHPFLCGPLRQGFQAASRSIRVRRSRMGREP